MSLHETGIAFTTRIPAPSAGTGPGQRRYGDSRKSNRSGPCSCRGRLHSPIPQEQGADPTRDLLEFAFRSEPIVKLIAWEAVPFKINFICAEPDFFATWCAVCRSIFCLNLRGAGVNLRGFISLCVRSHTRVRSSCG